MDGIISGDSDLVVEGGPPVPSPGEVLRRLHVGPVERRLLVTALWNLQPRLKEGTVDPESPDVSAFLAIVHAAVVKLGGDPGAALFGVPNRTRGALHAEHVDEAERLAQAFAILDRYVAIQRLLSSH